MHPIDEKLRMSQTYIPQPEREVKNLGDFPLKFLDSGIRYRGYILHKKAYDLYLIFYIISDSKQEGYVLRVIKDLMSWQGMLNWTKIYHYLNYVK